MPTLSVPYTRSEGTAAPWTTVIDRATALRSRPEKVAHRAVPPCRARDLLGLRTGRAPCGLSQPSACLVAQSTPKARLALRSPASYALPGRNGFAMALFPSTLCPIIPCPRWAGCRPTVCQPHQAAPQPRAPGSSQRRTRLVGQLPAPDVAMPCGSSSGGRSLGVAQEALQRPSQTPDRFFRVCGHKRHRAQQLGPSRELHAV